MRTGLQDLLAIFQTLAEGALGLTQALLDAILSAPQDIANALRDLGSVRIPILSALWHAITGSDLTFMDLLSFVLAFPVTFTYRAVEGSYPGDDAAGFSVAATGNSVAKKVLGLVGGFGMVAAGFISAYIDLQALLIASMGWSGGSLIPKPLLLTAVILLFSGTVSLCYTAYSASKAIGKP